MFKKEDLLNAMQPTMDEFKKFPWESAPHYATWSAQTHYFVKHSTRLFAAAASRTPLTDNPIHDRFLSHLREEKGHENLSIRDIRMVGLDIHQIPELPATRNVYQTQYYWIEHVSAYSFFGYLLALESLAVYVGPHGHERISKAHGSKASSFLKVHAEEDIGHVAEVIEWIEKMSAPDKEQVYANFTQTLENYRHMLVDIQAQEFLKQLKAA